MQLQVKNSGAWKNVSWFDLKDREVVEKSAMAICWASALVESKITFRLVDGVGKVVSYCDANKRWVHTVHADQVVG
jgi:hypothetical protein